MRNNQRRASSARGRRSASKAAAKPTILSYEVPTEFVALPSRGRFYPKNHPFHKKETVEIRYMTAKEEDILSSQSLITEGIVIDRFLESVMVDDVDSTTLLVGDRSAIMIAARISGYGSDYGVQITCPNCGSKSEMSFDLNEEKTIREKCFDADFLSDNGVTVTAGGDIKVVLPISNFKVQLKMLTSLDQDDYAVAIKEAIDSSIITTSLKLIIEKIEDCDDPKQIDEIIMNLPAKDSKFIRALYPKLLPAVELRKDFKCQSCFHMEDMEVPISAAFFWPK